MKKAITLGIFLILNLFVFAGCSNSKSAQMTNELRFSLKGISSLTLSYDEEKITIFESDSDALVIKEYMTESKSSYYAKVTEGNESIYISEGGKPFFKDGFSRYIEVYLPESYRENLTVTSTNGDIDFSGMNLDLSMLRVDNSSGNIRLDNAVASNIHLSSTSGTLYLGNIEANQISLETTSGSVICTKLNGNVIYTLTLPKNLEFEFQATTKNGSVSTNFQQDVTVNGHTTSGSVGSNPTITVKVETNNGDIEVTQ